MKLITLTEFIGRFHPVVVHLPIGILLIGILLQWMSVKEKYKISPEVIRIILLTGMFTALISCITGYMLSLSGDYDGNLVSLHMWMGISVVVASMIMVVRTITGKLDFTYRAANICLFILIIITGHLGGSLTHGANYLTSALQSDEINQPPQKIITNVQEARVYEDLVQPIFQTKCYSCHGPHKQKGGLRLDDPKWILKGGKDGLAIDLNKINNSELIKRLMLPKQEEHHMPPREKAQLTDKQIAIINWWVEEGADFNRKVKDLQQPQNIKSTLISLQGNQTQNSGIAYIPEGNVARADENSINILKLKGVVVMPISQNSHFLTVDFVTCSNFTNKDIKLLLPLKNQIIWLKIGHTIITDSSLYVISELNKLTYLDLNHTAITDKGLSSLTSLHELRLLNLVGTAVTEKGVMNLANLKHLQSLYIYQSKVITSDFVKLKKFFPKTNIDTGGYKVPLLATDTTLVKAPKAIKD